MFRKSVFRRDQTASSGRWRMDVMLSWVERTWTRFVVVLLVSIFLGALLEVEGEVQRRLVGEEGSLSFSS